MHSTVLHLEPCATALDDDGDGTNPLARRHAVERRVIDQISMLLTKSGTLDWSEHILWTHGSRWLLATCHNGAKWTNGKLFIFI